MTLILIIVGFTALLASSSYYGCKRYGGTAFISVGGSVVMMFPVLWFFGDPHIHR
jgi:heme/copper-type cytochrome/quinol oxidase subunit 1